MNEKEKKRKREKEEEEEEENDNTKEHIFVNSFNLLLFFLLDFFLSF